MQTQHRRVNRGRAKNWATAANEKGKWHTRFTLAVGKFGTFWKVSPVLQTPSLLSSPSDLKVNALSPKPGSRSLSHSQGVRDAERKGGQVFLAVKESVDLSLFYPINSWCDFGQMLVPQFLTYTREIIALLCLTQVLGR